MFVFPALFPSRDPLRGSVRALQRLRSVRPRCSVSPCWSRCLRDLRYPL